MGFHINFNPDISKQVHEVIFPHIRSIVSHPPLIINNIPVAQTNVQQNWEAHIDKKVNIEEHLANLNQR